MDDYFKQSMKLLLYFPLQAEPVTQLHRISSPKARIIKGSLGKFQTSYGLLLYLRFVLLFPCSALFHCRTNS